MRLALVLTLAALMCGCYSMPEKLKKALTIQNEYTREYVAKVGPLVQDEETKGIGARLSANCDAIDAMLKEE